MKNIESLSQGNLTQKQSVQNIISHEISRKKESCSFEHISTSEQRNISVIEPAGNTRERIKKQSECAG